MFLVVLTEAVCPENLALLPVHTLLLSVNFLYYTEVSPVSYLPVLISFIGSEDVLSHQSNFLIFCIIL